MSATHSIQKLWLALALALFATPAFAQGEAPHGAQGEAPPHGDDAAGHAGPEAQRAAAGAAGDGPTASDRGSEHHSGGPNAHDAEEHDPSKHFNFLGFQPGNVFDYRGKDEYGGVYGDGKMVDPATGHVVNEEEPASPPFIFMLFNFAVLLALLAWKGRPIARQVAAERHDLIKTALDEAAKLRQQAADKLAQYETRLKDADKQIQALVEGMRIDAENDKKRILAAAEVQAAQMKRDAEQRIAAEIEYARAQLTREVTAAAATATEKLLREKMTAGDQQNLVSAFITDVQSAGAIGRTGRGDVR
jgi:F0F1-type ATP synthase membrane subunit b/b'